MSDSAAWLAARPIAHRGLHDVAAGIPENSLAAARAAIAEGYAIEADVRLARDGVVVFHDAKLRRLCDRDARVADLGVAELALLRLGASEQTIPSLEQFLALVRGRVPLLLELKSPGTGEGIAALVEHVVGLLDGYVGPLAVMSFDPDLVALVRRHAPWLARGIVVADFRPAPDRRHGGVMQRFVLSKMLHLPRTRPHFVACRADDLPQPVVALLRKLRRVPILAWTIRTPGEARRVAPLVDQIIFEGFRPDGGAWMRARTEADTDNGRHAHRGA